MAVWKSKGTRVGVRLVTNVIEHPLLHHFYAGPSFHFNNAAGMLHYISNQPCSFTLSHCHPYFPEQFLYTCSHSYFWRLVFISHELYAYGLCHTRYNQFKLKLILLLALADGWAVVSQAEITASNLPRQYSVTWSWSEYLSMNKNTSPTIRCSTWKWSTTDSHSYYMYDFRSYLPTDHVPFTW